ncbi:ribonuclease Z mitochondrial precursor [Lojkania enalia]|uniref:ribonuclease Z n=1 Tax=Lojkania enalia TaxID=147567 RepID=A0A9P4K225_9PLEO|nr:ribonuclease Z mitochondrial precursor [Didymosphaeria enalia]
MDVHIQFVTTPTADTPGTTLMLTTAKQNYLFGNESEGTQRALTQNGMRLMKVQDFFVTGRTEWSNVGGTVGLILTLADATATAYQSALEYWRSKSTKNLPEPVPPKLNIHGPPNLKHLFATCRRFIFRKGMPVTITEYKETMVERTDEGAIPPTWKDQNIRVWALAVKPPRKDNEAWLEDALAAKQERYDKVLNSFEDEQAPVSESQEDRDSRFDRIRSQVLDHMFNSSWKFDTLVEKHISEVEMPAAIYIRHPETKELQSYAGPFPRGEEPLPDIRVLVRTPWPGALVQALPPTKPAVEAISYIVNTFPSRGKFDAKRAQELGIQPGPIFRLLTQGKSVKNASGETITSDMVMGPEKPAQGVAILDVPSLEYLEPLLQREEILSGTVMDDIRLCIWILGPGIAGHPTLQTFMQKLDKVEHVISSADTCPNRLALDSVAAQTVRLGQIDPDRYQLPFHDNSTLPQNSLYGRASCNRLAVSSATRAERGLKFRLKPIFELAKDAGPPPLLNVSEVEKSTSLDIIKLAQSAQRDVENDAEVLKSWRERIQRPDTEIITLGTGSALPSKYRNVSATLIKVPGIGNYLLDCGENTLGQLQRVFKPDELVEVLRNLRMIWVSHLHADHHLGTASVIKAWYAVVHDSIPVYAPPSMSSISTEVSTYGLSVVSHEGMLRWLFEYSSLEDFGYSRIVPLDITSNQDGSEPGSTLSLCPLPNRGKADQDMLRREDYETVLGVSDIQACYVSHCRGAMAVSLTFPDSSADEMSEIKTKPLKVSYSGDCRPSIHFTRIGQDSTVLVHEATFDDELKSDAKAKKHSTTSEALGIGAKMKAKAVVLTHFSQRYQKIPVLETVENDAEGEEDGLLDPGAAEDVNDGPAMEDDVDPRTEELDVGVDKAFPHNHAVQPDMPSEQVIKVRAKDMKVAVAFDYMRVKVGDIAQLEKFNMALGRLLAEKDEDDRAGERNGNGKRVSDGEGRKGKKGKRNN